MSIYFLFVYQDQYFRYLYYTFQEAIHFTTLYIWLFLIFHMLFLSASSNGDYWLIAKSDAVTMNCCLSCSLLCIPFFQFKSKEWLEIHLYQIPYSWYSSSIQVFSDNLNLNFVINCYITYPPSFKSSQIWKLTRSALFIICTLNLPHSWGQLICVSRQGQLPILRAVLSFPNRKCLKSFSFNFGRNFPW